jgi:hypothetical protein
MMASRYAHAKQFKRHHRQLRLLRSRLGRIISDIRRKITGRPELEAVFEAPIARAAQIRSQRQRQRGWKLYSFHAPRSNASSMKGCGSSGCRRAEVHSGQTEKNSLRANVFRVTPESGHCSMQLACLKCANERHRSRMAAQSAGIVN